MPNSKINNQSKINSAGTNSVKARPVSARLQAIWWLLAVIKDGRSVNELLATSSNLIPSDVSFAKQLLFGSLRFYHQIKAILDQLLEKQLKLKDMDVYCILIVGIYQLKYLSVPDHAAISESVELTKNIRKKWASGLINAILRSFQRRQAEISEKLDKANTYLYSHPNWIINQLKLDWPEKYQAILIENNERAPMAIRVNSALIDLSGYQQLLHKEAIESSPHAIAKDALVLKKPCDVYQLPGFLDGLVTVQDPAAQLVVDLMDLKPNLRVLDGCAAPGGKTSHILQREPSTVLTSIEMSEKRLEKISEVLERLKMNTEQYNIQLINADFLDFKNWWNGELFDRILIDVPCSASGVIRRNPDIKIHRKKTDMMPLVDIQYQILQSAWKMLKPRGRLIYATCSIFKMENENQINRFVDKNNARIIEMPVTIDNALKHNKLSVGYQIFPGDQQMDGFYFCGLEKQEIR
ncbi:MAG: 16S rRNA (cytosine(967)-C(5))-methyltransferase RsmB [Kangiellaceae bacterium]